MSKIYVNKCEYKCGVECHKRDYPILNCADVKIKDCHYKQLKQLRQKNRELKKDLKNVEKDRAWIKERCIDAGKELGKHSFAWDGKEKNLVVQALELNERYEQLKAGNEKLSTQNYYLDKANLELAEENKNYLKCLDEIEKICTHETINLTDSCVSGGRYFEILQKIKEVKGNE